MHAVMMGTSGKSSKSNDKPSIVVFRIGQLGDSLVSMPAIHEIRKKFSSHHMILLTDRHANKSGYISSWDILGPTGWFDDVIFYEPATSIIDSFKSMITINQLLSSLSPEYVFDLSPYRRKLQIVRDFLFFTRIVGIDKYRFDRSVRTQPKKRTNLPAVIPEWKRLMQIACDDRLAEDLCSGAQFQLPVPDSNVIEAESLLDRCHMNSSNCIIGIGPGSKMPSKLWPFERFSDLGQKLLGCHPNIHFVVLGGAEDKEIGDKLCGEWGDRSHNFAGKLSVYGSAAILKKCSCYVGNDTGTMHIAGLCHTPCVAIFSSRDYPGKWQPFGSGHEILRSDVPCQGCMLTVCPYDNKCLRLIAVDSVISATKRILGI